MFEEYGTHPPEVDKLDVWFGPDVFSSESFLWQYWFTTDEQKRETGAWWNRELRGSLAPAVVRRPDGSIELEEAPRAPVLDAIGLGSTIPRGNDSAGQTPRAE